MQYNYRRMTWPKGDRFAYGQEIIYRGERFYFRARVPGTYLWIFVVNKAGQLTTLDLGYYMQIMPIEHAEAPTPRHYYQKLKQPPRAASSICETVFVDEVHPYTPDLACLLAQSQIYKKARQTGGRLLHAEMQRLTDEEPVGPDEWNPTQEELDEVMHAKRHWPPLLYGDRKGSK